MAKNIRQKFGALLMLLCAVGVALLFFNPPRKSAALQTTVDSQHIPIGDDKVSSRPRVGYVWSCQTQFNGGGAFRDGEWIKGDGSWDKTIKVTVDGDVSWADALMIITVVGSERQVTSNALPNHPTGIYPIQSSDDAYQYDRNPNSITEQTLSFTLPLNPTLADSPSCVPMGMIGILHSGVALFNALDGEGRDAAAHEIQDNCEGHPERSGEYHYHTISPCAEFEANPQGHSELIGYALDGFGIFGNHGEAGQALTNADLDECHGHTHEVDWDGQKAVMYHYHATLEYPYSIGCFRGTPIQVAQAGGNAPGQPPQGGQSVGNRPPQPPPGGPPGGNPPPPGQGKP